MPGGQAVGLLDMRHFEAGVVADTHAEEVDTHQVLAGDSPAVAADIHQGDIRILAAEEEGIQDILAVDTRLAGIRLVAGSLVQEVDKSPEVDSHHPEAGCSWICPRSQPQFSVVVAVVVGDDGRENEQLRRPRLRRPRPRRDLVGGQRTLLTGQFKN